MSFRSKQPVAPSRHRSSSATRNGNNNGLSFTNRPRSMGYYNNMNPYSSYSSASSSPYNSYSSPYNSYTSNYKSPYFSNNYRNGGNSGYASLTIPAKALTNTNVVIPSYSKMYDNSRDYVSNDGHKSRREMHRSGSFNRDRSLSRSQSSLASGMGSKSISLTSLNSEGYIVSQKNND